MATRWHARSLWGAILIGIASVPTPVQSAGAADHGLRVGDRAPNFTLKAADDQEHALTNLLGRGKVALVFYRSADW